MVDLVPRSFWRFPATPSLWEDEEDWGTLTNWPSGLSLSEDNAHVYVQVAVPGVDPKYISRV